MKQIAAIFLAFLSMTIPLVLPSLSIAASLEYFYDPVGRLQATVSETGEVTIYTYDTVGNLLYVTKETFSPASPVLQSINPDVLFIGSTTSVAIAGENLLTTKKIVTGNPFVSIGISAVTDTRITADITVSSQAQPGPVNLTVTTQYGSADIQTILTTSQISMGPGLLSLAPGTSGNITVSIYPPLGTAKTIQIANSGPFVVGAPQSVTVPASGTVAFSVNALREGLSYISSGPSVTTVYVTSSIFTPVSGEQLTPAARQVSVYIDSASTAATSSLPVSTYIEPPPGTSVTQSTPFSVYIDSLSGGSATVSSPVSIYIDSQAGSATRQSAPVSTYIEPAGGATSVSTPVSTKISP